MSKRIIDDTDSISERLKKIKEEEVEAQKPTGECMECQKLKRPCDNSCYIYCDTWGGEYELDYSCGGTDVSSTYCYCCDHDPHIDTPYEWYLGARFR